MAHQQIIMGGQARPFTFTDTIASSIEAYNLELAALDAGWNGSAPLNATISIQPGVSLIGSSTAPGLEVRRAAFKAYPKKSSLAILNSGNILGRGGDGGKGGDVSGDLTGVIVFAVGSNGGAGGPGIVFDAALNTVVTNDGSIAGGGGGGGGGGATLIYEAFMSGGGGGGAPSLFGFDTNAGIAGIADGTGIYPDVEPATHFGAANIPGSPGQWSAKWSNLSGTNGLGVLPNYGPGGIGGLVPEYGGAGSGGASGSYGIPGFDGTATGAGFAGSGGAAGAAFLNGQNVAWTNYGHLFGAFDSFGIWSGLGQNKVTTFGGRTLSPVVSTPRLFAWTSDLGPYWYWTNQTANLSAPAGTTTFVTFWTNATASPVDVYFYGCVDNEIVGAGFDSGPFDYVSTGLSAVSRFDTPGSQTGNLSLSPGPHLIYITVSNTAASPAGFNLCLRRRSDDLMLTHPSQWWW